MPKLEDAIILATKAHAGQVDKAYKPYILHPMRVMLKMHTEEEMIVAILHDVVEDTKVTIDELRTQGYSKNVLKAIEILTHDDKEEYFEYVKRCKTNPISCKVKLADATDNMDLTRIIDPQEKDYKRRKKYIKVIEMLSEN